MKKQDKGKLYKMYKNIQDNKEIKECANELDCIENVYDMLLYR